MGNENEIELELDGVRYVTMQEADCKKCAFNKNKKLCVMVGSLCIPVDGPYVIFVERRP